MSKVLGWFFGKAFDAVDDFYYVVIDVRECLFALAEGFGNPDKATDWLSSVDIKDGKGK